MKYLSTVVTFFYLNVVCGISMAVLGLLVVYLYGVYQMLRNKCKGPTYAEKVRKEWKETEIVTEDTLKRITIAFYLGANWLVEIFREIIQWNNPLFCGGLTFFFLAASAFTTLMGDGGLFWLCIIMSFFLPSLVMRRSRKKEEKLSQLASTQAPGAIVLTDTGNKIWNKVVELLEQIDSKIPKFSDYQ